MHELAHIRLFEPGDLDYEAIARVASCFAADQLGDYEYARVAGLRDFDAAFAGSGHVLRRYVAEAGAVIAGYAQLFHIPWLREPGCFWMSVRVDPAYWRRGIGGRLYKHLIADLGALGATAAWIEAHESTPTIAAGLEQRGFRELFRSWPFTLDTRGFDLARFQQAMDRVTERGIAITTLADEHARDPDCLPKLYELHTAITRDIPLPGHPHPAPGLAWFERYAYSSPLALPEVFFIARDGVRYIGESFLQRIDGVPDELNQKATGVHTDYRGYGIAMALKLATIAYAQWHGYTRIWTGVESNNPSMLAINARLSFAQGPGLIVFEKDLRGGTRCTSPSLEPAPLV